MGIAERGEQPTCLARKSVTLGNHSGSALGVRRLASDSAQTYSQMSPSITTQQSERVLCLLIS